jgi:capsular exopolysaccharide synthesis family protein
MIMCAKKKKNLAFQDSDHYILTEDSPFAVQEAYKAIRTNLIFSIPEEKCKKILLTSSMQGEAKSTTSTNLAIAFAQNHDRVLLIDCDLRLPTDADKLGIARTPGLSNVLVGMCSVDDAIQRLPSELDVITAGDTPPNPSELLGSAKMEQLMEQLEGRYDYIILDTPPVNTVADASILTKLVSGVVVVVRQGISTRESLNDALTKLNLTDAKVLGFIMTGVVNEKRKNGYGYGYGYGYASANAKRK